MTKIITRNKMRTTNLITLGALCLLTMLAGCKGTPQKTVSEDAAEEEEVQTIFWLNEEQQNIIRNGNDFSIKLFRKIAEEEGKKNVFVSTIGMYYSLNIINNGASGRTRQEICDALNIDTTDIDRVNKICRILMKGQERITENEEDGPSSYMRTATIFQAGKHVDIDKSFQKVLEHDYSAGIIKGDVDADCQRRIDEWCAKHTDGLLSSFPLTQRDDRSANLLVANFFNGRWAQEFDKEDTKAEPFHGGTSAKVSMMNMTESEKLFSYAELKDFSLLRIPYVGGYRLYVILPKKVDGLKALLQSLDGEKLRTAIGQLKSYDIVYVKIPKFEVEYSFNANDYLSSLGVGRMFTESAELNRIQPEPMIIKDIIQKTRVILDEDGTRAGAITSSSFLTLGEVSKPTEAYFYADHPFAYIIEDPFGSYCFMGTFWGGGNVSGE